MAKKQYDNDNVPKEYLWRHEAMKFWNRNHGGCAYEIYKFLVELKAVKGLSKKGEYMLEQMRLGGMGEPPCEECGEDCTCDDPY